MFLMLALVRLLLMALGQQSSCRCKKDKDRARPRSDTKQSTINSVSAIGDAPGAESPYRSLLQPLYLAMPPEARGAHKIGTKKFPCLRLSGVSMRL